MAAITFRHIRKTFEGGFTAVADLDLVVRDGESLVLVGPSGCGKTTSLRMIAGLEQPTAGDLLIGERVVTSLPGSRRDIAMVFQSYALYPHLTVWDNLAFPLRQQGVTRAEVHQRVSAAVELLGLGTMMERLPRQLSGGQRQRVALGRAVVRRPAAFLLDEPLSNLDAQLRSSIRVELRDLQRRLGTTTLYVTHDQVEAMTLGDRLAVMHQGRVQQVGTPDEVYHQPATCFVAEFIGTPTINLLTGRWLVDGGRPWLVVAEGLRIPMERHSAAEVMAADDAELTLGIRPESVHIGTAWAPATGSAVLVGRLLLVEHLGDRQYLHLAVAGCPRPLVVQEDRGSRHRPGEVLSCAFDPAFAHLFAGTGPTAPRMQGANHAA